MNSSVIPVVAALIGVSVAFVGCGRERDTRAKPSATGNASAAPSASAQAQVFSDPFGFPARPAPAEAGSLVLVPSRGSLRRAAQRDLEPTTLAYTMAKVVSAGTAVSELEWLGEQRGSVPNALLIPLTREGRARRGEVVLSAGVAGSGIERSVVTSEGESLTPRVRSLDLPVERADEPPERELERGTFKVVAHAGELGSTLACEADAGFEPYVLAVADDQRWLGVGFAGRARIFERSRCKLLPLAASPSAGAHVFVPLAGRFAKAVVEAVEPARGRIRVGYEFAGANAQALIGFVNVATEALR